MRALLCAVLAVGGCAGGPKPMNHDDAKADLVLMGGTVYTMNPLMPRAEAVAVRNGRVEAVGSAAEVRPLIGPKTQVIDLRGRAVTAGLVDGHCHLIGLGKSLEEISLRGAASPEEAAQRVKDALAERAAGEWVLGRGWDQNLWAKQEFPKKAVLDAVAPDHPVALRRIDGHAVWVNSAALVAAGITRKTAAPPGGKILRDRHGEPTGVLIDEAMPLVEKHIPVVPASVRERRILKAADTAVAAGLTGVHEMGIDQITLGVYRDLAKRGRLKLRVYAFLSEDVLPTLAERKPDEDPDGTAMLVVRGVKLYADGALGSRGAALLAPYADDPKNQGNTILEKEQLALAARIVKQAGWQLAVHAIGDRANREVLDAVEAVGANGLRFRIEHAQVVAPEDIPRFAALGVVAAMQPTHATSDMEWADERLGPKRLVGAYAWRSMLDAGVHVVGGSDFPVEEVPPVLGLYAAVTRQDRAGKPPGGWLPEQRLTLEEALRMYTVEPAYAAYAEKHRGMLAPGYVADLTVFDRDLLADQSLVDTHVDLTIVGGSIVYDRSR